MIAKPEFVGMGRQPMRYGLRRSNSILWAPRLVASFALRMESGKPEFVGHKAELTIDNCGISFGNT